VPDDGDHRSHHLRLGTRRSALALAQAGLVADALSAAAGRPSSSCDHDVRDRTQPAQEPRRPSAAPGCS